MSMAKAIETEYGGVKFRSRIEARWAMVLDELGIAWDYEREGYTFTLNNGAEVRYLPDFFLPDQSSWLEIKPEAKALSDQAGGDATHKAWRLEEATGQTVFIAFGLKDYYIGHMVVDEEIHMEQGYFERCGEHGKWMLVTESQDKFACGCITAHGWGSFLDDVIQNAVRYRHWDPK